MGYRSAIVEHYLNHVLELILSALWSAIAIDAPAGSEGVEYGL